jgi:D-tyrosyl-tRNA(Tyr) deacylase
MISLVQRVARASVETFDPPRRASIKRGLLVLVCAMQGDEDRDVIWMANKLAGLRIFPDADARMNRSLRDIGGAMLVVSQFTLAGDCTKGFRPSFIRAAAPAQGEAQYEALVKTLRDSALMDVQTGVFGASMQVELVNDGPVTIWIDSRS